MAMRLPRVGGDMPIDRGATSSGQSASGLIYEHHLDLQRYMVEWTARHELLLQKEQLQLLQKEYTHQSGHSVRTPPLSPEPSPGSIPLPEGMSPPVGITAISSMCNLEVAAGRDSSDTEDARETTLAQHGRDTLGSFSPFAPMKRNLVSDLHHATLTQQQLLEVGVEAERADLYSFFGVCEAVDRSPMWQHVCSLVIMANAFCLAFTTELVIESPGDPNFELFQNLERVFCCFYLMELGLRMGAQRKQFFIGPDLGWNIFDALLAVSAAQEQAMVAFASDSASAQNFSYLRVVRLLKMVKFLRMIRLLRAFRELRLVMNSILGSMRALLWSFLLIAGICFMFGVCFVQAVNEFAASERGATCKELLATATQADDLYVLAGLEDGEYAAQSACTYWGSIGLSMLSLFQASTGGYDWELLGRPLWEVSSLYYCILCLYIGFFLFIVMNSLTSLFLDSVMSNAQQDEDQIMQDQLARKEEYISRVVEIFSSIDEDGSGMVSYDEFMRHKHDPMLVAFAQSLDIEPNALNQFFAILSGGGQRSVDLETFVVGCIKVRGNARSMDLLDVLITQEMIGEEQNKFAKYCKEQFSAIRGAMQITGRETFANHSIMSRETLASQQQGAS